MKEPLILGAGMPFDMPDTEQIEHIAKAGWDGVFTRWYDGCDLKSTVGFIKSLGLVCQSVHADFRTVDKLWDADGDMEADMQIRCIEDCAEAGAHLVVMHAIIGMEKNSPTQSGIDRFAKIVDAAKRYGVKIALENTEGECYLDALLNAFKGEKHIGFCLDTGHEMCYNHGMDLLSKYGDRLFGTHLNDNMGQTGESITWHDDLHLMPFDGIIDWNSVAKRLKKTGFDGPLTFELKYGNCPESAYTAKYSGLDFDGYLTLALEKAKKFARLLK